MKSSALGKRTSNAEVQDITPTGIWVFVNGREYMLPFSDFPWFRGAKISEILNLKLLHADHLFWPDLDVDLGLEVLQTPEEFPLVAHEKAKRPYRSRKS